MGNRSSSVKGGVDHQATGGKPQAAQEDSGDQEGKKQEPQSGDVVCNICISNGTETCIPNGKVTNRCEQKRTVCRSCLERHIHERVHKEMYDGITCVCTSASSCNVKLGFLDVRTHATQETFARYDQGLLRRALEANEEFCWCANPQCASGQLHGSRTEYPVMRCHACQFKTCFTHHCEWHSGRSCKQFDRDAALSEEVALVQLLETSKYQRCPSCKNGVEKNKGCDHMTCRCKHEFCWRCLAPYRGAKGINEVGCKAHKKTCKFYA